MRTRQKKIIFISSRQKELQIERNSLREMINEKDKRLSEMFIAKTFEHDLAGRKESVKNIIEDCILKSDIYLGIFDKEYSDVVKREYNQAVSDKTVKKEIIIFVRERGKYKRHRKLRKFLRELKNPETGHSCLVYNSIDDLLKKSQKTLLNYAGRMIEGFIISTDIHGPNLDRARMTNFPEKLRRALLQPPGISIIPRGRKGIPEYYRYDENRKKIDVTWRYIKDERNVSNSIKNFYRERYMKLFDTSENGQRRTKFSEFFLKLFKKEDS